MSSPNANEHDTAGLMAPAADKPMVTRSRLAAGGLFVFAVAAAAVVVFAPAGENAANVNLDWSTVPDWWITTENSTVRDFVDTYFLGQAPTQADICNLCMLRRCGVASDGTLASCAKDYKYTFPQSLEAKRCMCGCCSVQCLAPAGCEALSKSTNGTQLP